MTDPNPFGGPVTPEYLKFFSHREQHLEEARNNPNCLAHYCFKDKDGESLVQGRMHREWQAAMTRHKKATIIGPRLHGKTIQVCQIRPLFELGRDPDLCIKIIGSNDQQAIKRVKALRGHMERNLDLHRVFPHLKRHVKRGGRRPKDVPYNDGEWNLGSLTVAGRKKWWQLDPSIQAKSVLSSISGDRADILIWDDGADRRNSVELPRMRDRIVEGVDDYINTLHPGTGRAWAIGTLWHESDLNHRFMKIWPTYWYEILIQHTNDGPSFGSYVRHANGYQRRSDDPLWKYWNQKRLLERLEDIGLRKFMRGFGNRPMHQDEIHIDPDWIEYYAEPPTKEWHVIISVDSASTTGSKSNWTGYVFLAIHPYVVAGLMPASHKGAIKCFKAYHRKQTAPDRVKVIERIYQNFVNIGVVVDAVCVENRGGGQGTMDHLIERGKIPRRKIQPVRPKTGKTDRVDRISHYVENQLVQFEPDMDPGLGSNLVREDDGNVVSELVSVPLGEFDDLADAFSQGVFVAMHTYPGLKPLAAAAELDDWGDQPAQVVSGGSKMWSF